MGDAEWMRAFATGFGFGVAAAAVLFAGMLVARRQVKPTTRAVREYMAERRRMSSEPWAQVTASDLERIYTEARR